MRYIYHETRNNEDIFSLGRCWYRNEVLHFEFNTSFVICDKCNYLKLLLISKSNVELRAAWHVCL